MTRTIHCLTHQCTAESFIARCYYALWAGALERCDLREMDLRYPDVQTDGQTALEVEA